MYNVFLLVKIALAMKTITIITITIYYRIFSCHLLVGYLFIIKLWLCFFRIMEDPLSKFISV